MRCKTGNETLDENTCSSVCLYALKAGLAIEVQNGTRKPSDPRENEIKGGTRVLKSEEACRIVPSPPSVKTTSTTRSYSVSVLTV